MQKQKLTTPVRVMKRETPGKELELRLRVYL